MSTGRTKNDTSPYALDGISRLLIRYVEKYIKFLVPYFQRPTSLFDNVKKSNKLPENICRSISTFARRSGWAIPVHPCMAAGTVVSKTFTVGRAILNEIIDRRFVRYVRPSNNVPKTVRDYFAGVTNVIGHLTIHFFIPRRSCAHFTNSKMKFRFMFDFTRTFEPPQNTGTQLSTIKQYIIYILSLKRHIIRRIFLRTYHYYIVSK